EPVDETTAPEFHRLVSDLAARAGLPKPKIYIIENPQPNAFATGRNPENAAVAATTGLLKMLSRDEIEGVMAHELAHVKNRDSLIMTITAVLAGAIGMLANVAFFFGGSPDREAPLGGLGALLGLLLGPLPAAAVKIPPGAAQIPNHSAEANPATAHLFIINPLHGRGADNLFSTHPNTQNRIERLLAMEEGTPAARAAPQAPVRRSTIPNSTAKGPWS